MTWQPAPGSFQDPAPATSAGIPSRVEIYMEMCYLEESKSHGEEQI